MITSNSYPQHRGHVWVDHAGTFSHPTKPHTYVSNHGLNSNAFAHKVCGSYRNGSFTCTVIYGFRYWTLSSMFYLMAHILQAISLKGWVCMWMYYSHRHFLLHEYSFFGRTYTSKKIWVLGSMGQDWDPLILICTRCKIYIGTTLSKRKKELWEIKYCYHANSSISCNTISEISSVASPAPHTYALIWKPLKNLCIYSFSLHHFCEK